MIVRRLTVLLAAGLLFAGCAPVGGGESAPPGTPAVSAWPESSPPLSDEEQIQQAAQAVLGALAAQDYEALAELVDPVEGVRLVPYGYIDAEDSVALTSAQVAELSSDDKIYTWGADPGTGEPMRMTFAQYNERYLYDQQFLQADEVAVDRPLGEGSSLDNTAEVFPGAHYVDFHFTGFDEQYEGLDWETLRIVLRQREGGWRVVGLIHNSWTP